MFGENRLRVRALFTVINEQNKLNAKNDNVIEGIFGEAKTSALAAQSFDEQLLVNPILPDLWVNYARCSAVIGSNCIKITVKGLEFPLNKTQG